MTMTRSTSGLLLRDEFSTDTSGDYDGYEGALSVADGNLVDSNGQYIVRKSISGVACVTARSKSSHDSGGGGASLWANGTLDAAADVDGYGFVDYGAAASRLRRYIDAANVVLATFGSLWAADTYALSRMYLDSGVKVRGGATTLGDVTASSADVTYTSSMYGGITFVYSTGRVDWLDLRTSHQIICTGMTNGHYLRVSDGTTTAEAAASSGTATVDASAVLFPLATLQIRTASGGGGSLVDSLGTGDYADMGGGDTYEYSGGTTGGLLLLGVGGA